jgi:hypothetical protein
MAKRGFDSDVIELVTGACVFVVFVVILSVIRHYPA